MNCHRVKFKLFSSAYVKRCNIQKNVITIKDEKEMKWSDHSEGRHKVIGAGEDMKNVSFSAVFEHEYKDDEFRE